MLSHGAVLAGVTASHHGVLRRRPEPASVQQLRRAPSRRGVRRGAVHHQEPLNVPPPVCSLLVTDLDSRLQASVEALNRSGTCWVIAPLDAPLESQLIALHRYHLSIGSIIKFSIVAHGNQIICISSVLGIILGKEPSRNALVTCTIATMIDFVI